ncbi:unnamed protein product [Gemmataceae bacterium]|nr:unnamed protein product [Gemmataceae bacterium]VTT97953.1 unnamed protein product [Gemmataceae bacterium]
MYGTDPTASQYTTVTPPIGFTATDGRFFPLALTPERVEAIRDTNGMDLPRVARRGLKHLFDGGGPKALVRFAEAVYLAAGGDDDPTADGVRIGESLVSPEQFGTMLADPTNFERAGQAFVMAVAAYFKNRRG